MIFFSECQCNEDGSVDTSCDDGSGKCSCNPNIVGNKCTQCAAEHFAFPTCDGKYYCQVGYGVSNLQIQLKKYETAPYFFLLNQNLTCHCLLISVFLPVFD